MKSICATKLLKRGASSDGGYFLSYDIIDIMQWAKQKQTGFTIVELLIVVVVIAILAAITVVSYNGISQQSRFSVMRQDIATINKAILMYHSEKGHYPYGTPATGGNTTGTRLNIPGLSEYLSAAPSMPNDGLGGYYAYIWSENGANYKLVRLVPSGVQLPSVEQGLSNADTTRPGRGWGVWSPGGSGI